LDAVARPLRPHRPHTVLRHDPYRTNGFHHRDHRKAGIAATDAVYPYARDHLHFPEHITGEGLEPHRVRELWYWGMDEPNVIVDVTDGIDRQIAALIRHESQVPGFSIPAGQTIGDRVKKNAAEHANGYGFEYGAVFRRLLARSRPVVLAHVVGTLDRLSEGRVILGVGIATDGPAIRKEFAAVGVPFERRVGRVLETIEICRALWSRDHVSFSGKHFTIDDA